MVRGTFGNIRLRNQLVEVEGGYTLHLPDGEETTIYEASLKYDEERAPRGPRGQRIRFRLLARLGGEGFVPARRQAVIAESFERIHRSNLIEMGVLPLVHAERALNPSA